MEAAFAALQGCGRFWDWCVHCRFGDFIGYTSWPCPVQ
jgi:hypothetical protein